MFRLNGSKDIFKQHILSSQMDDCLPCENFCPFKSTNVKAFQAHIFCAIFLVDEIVLMVLMEKI